MKWLIFQPELLLIILAILFLSSCSDDYEELVPFSNKTSKDRREHRIPMAPSTTVLESDMNYEF